MTDTTGITDSLNKKQVRRLNGGKAKAQMRDLSHQKIPAFKLEYGRTAKPGCHKCYGRGHVGLNGRGKYVMCSCVKVR